jgi:hypothetical protein
MRFIIESIFSGIVSQNQKKKASKQPKQHQQQKNMNFYRATIFLAISGLSQDIEAVNLRGCGSLEEQNRRVDVNRLNQLKINFDGFQEQ